MNRIIIHTDGSCLGNPGLGGWAALLQMVDSSEQVQAERVPRRAKAFLATVPAPPTTAWSFGRPQRAALKSPSLNVELVTDSQYVIGALNGNRARKNKALIALPAQLAGQLSVTTRHVRGHTRNTLMYCAS